MVGLENPRPRQPRAIETRRRLLQATVDSLVEYGYAGATTTAICEKAEVSQGALYKHFPTKASLIGDAIEFLFRHLIDDYIAGFLANDEPDRIGVAVRLLWKSFMSAPLQAAFEIYLAARTDPSLRTAIEPVLSQHRKNLRATAALLFPDVASRNPDFDLAINGIMATMQGAALMITALPSDDGARDEIAFVERLLRREFAKLESSV